MPNRKLLFLPALLGLVLVFTGCTIIEEETPTNELMEGVWKVTSIVDSSGTDITDTICSYFPAFVHLDDQNSVNSTLGPLFMYIVYGKNRFINVTAKLDEVFKYVSFTQGNITLTEGEWFIDKNKVVDEFTIEIKMRFPTVNTAETIFGLFNLPLPEIIEDALDLIVYHRFKHVAVEIDDSDPDQMVWEFNELVEPRYNTKDEFGDQVLYNGISVDAYSRCTITLERKLKTLAELVEEVNQ